jgi:hypothetical protein
MLFYFFWYSFSAIPSRSSVTSLVNRRRSSACDELAVASVKCSKYGSNSGSSHRSLAAKRAPKQEEGSVGSFSVGRYFHSRASSLVILTATPRSMSRLTWYKWPTPGSSDCHKLKKVSSSHGAFCFWNKRRTTQTATYVDQMNRVRKMGFTQP